jgi:hypothetical protein
VIVGTSSLGNEENCSVLLMGGSGTGKTTTAAKFPKPVFLMLEKNGRNSVELAAPGTQMLYCSTYKDITEACAWLEKNQGDYETVVVDSGSELADIVVNKILKDEGRDNLQIQDYKTIAMLSKRIINFLRGLNLNTVFLYLEDVKEYHDSTVQHVPLASGKSWQLFIPSLFSYAFKTCKFVSENSEGQMVPRFALETVSDENSTLKVPPALQRSRHIPADPKRWLGLLLPERYPEYIPTKKKGNKND